MSFLAKVIFFSFCQSVISCPSLSKQYIVRMFGLVCSLKCQNSPSHLGYTLGPAKDRRRGITMMKIPSLPNFGVGKYNLVFYAVWICSVDQVSKLTCGGSLVVAAPPIVPLYSAADLSVNQPGYWYVAFVPTRLIALIHWVFCVHCNVDRRLGEDIPSTNNI